MTEGREEVLDTATGAFFTLVALAGFALPAWGWAVAGVFLAGLLVLAALAVVFDLADWALVALGFGIDFDADFDADLGVFAGVAVFLVALALDLAAGSVTSASTGGLGIGGIGDSLA